MSRESERISTEASIWLVRLERGLRPEEGVQLRKWLCEAAQRDAIVQSAKLYHGADIVAVLAELVPVGFGSPPVKKQRQFWRPIVGGAAVIAAFLIAMAPLVVVHRKMPGVIDQAKMQPRPDWSPWGDRVYTTAPGQTRRIDLPDGTQLILNDHSEVGVMFSPRSRAAELKHGEAIFRIKLMQDRPFEVSAGGRRLLAPPSKFDVRVIDPQTIELTVLDGDVTVQGLPWRWPATPEEARLFDPGAFKDTTLGPMQAAVLQNATLNRYSVTPAALHSRLKWQPEEVLYVTP